MERAHDGQFFYGWAILAALMYVFVVALAFTNFGSAILNATMVADLKLSAGSLGTAFAVFAVANGVPGPLVAFVIGKVGARGSILIGLLIIAFASVLMATIVTDALAFAIIFGGVLGLGCAFAGAIPAQTILVEWFVVKRAFAFSILWVALAGGGAIVAPLLGYLVTATGDWRTGWWLLIGLCLIAALVVLLAVKNRPSDLGLIPDGRSSVTETTAAPVVADGNVWTFANVSKSASFWLIAISNVIAVVSTVVLFAFAFPHLRDFGHSPEFAGSMIGLLALAEIPGMLAVGFFGNRIAIRYIWGTGLLLMAAGLSLLANASTPELGYTFAICLGVGIGIHLVAFPIMISTYFGQVAFPKILGLLLMVSTIMGAASTMLIGYYYEQLGSYVLVFTILGLGLLACALMVAIARPQITQGAPLASVVATQCRIE